MAKKPSSGGKKGGEEMPDGPMTPIPEKLASAEQLGALKTDVAWIKTAIERNHICTSMPEIKSLRDWRRGLSAVVVAVVGVLAIFGVFLITTCNTQNERDTETRALVDSHTREIDAMKVSIAKVNEARAADAERISRAISDLPAYRAPAPGFCEGLSARQRRDLQRTLGSDDPCGG